MPTGAPTTSPVSSCKPAGRGPRSRAGGARAAGAPMGGCCWALLRSGRRRLLDDAGAEGIIRSSKSAPIRRVASAGAKPPEEGAA